MARVKRSVNARKKRRKVLGQAKGYSGGAGRQLQICSGSTAAVSQCLMG